MHFVFSGGRLHALRWTQLGTNISPLTKNHPGSLKYQDSYFSGKSFDRIILRADNKQQDGALQKQ
jgi:hypothetical protein